MLISKEYLQSLKDRIAALEEQNKRLINAVVTQSGMPAPFEVSRGELPKPFSGRKSWEQRRRELENSEKKFASS
jgi:hypothetical protein